MDEAARACGVCEFCNARSTKQCDGRLESGRTCDKRMCDAHAYMVARVQRVVNGRRVCTSRDLCPDCVHVGRTT